MDIIVSFQSHNISIDYSKVIRITTSATIYKDLLEYYVKEEKYFFSVFFSCNLIFYCKSTRKHSKKA
jgi:hypothetical protein